MTLHVVGNLCLDTTLMVPRFPVAGETLVALASRSGLGGKGLNQALAAARAGGRTILHAAVGDTDISRIIGTLANETGLTLRLEALSSPTDTSTLLVRPDGENLIVSAVACARAFDPLTTGALSIGPGDTLLMQGNLQPANTAACLAAARSRGATTVLNPSPVPEAAPDWRDVTIVVLNAGELAEFAGEGDPAEAARHLLERGARCIVVTLGSQGALLVETDRIDHVRASAVAVRDTSGAGDVFCGVLVASLAAGLDRPVALARATAAASLSVTREGALSSCPTPDELAALFRTTNPGSPAP